MMALDDRLLEDIGVRRDDLKRAIHLPLNVDAAKALRERAAKRRRQADR